MQPTNLTLEERERWAYAEGDVEKAKLLAEATDTEHKVTDGALRVAYDNGYDQGYADATDEMSD